MRAKRINCYHSSQVGLLACLLFVLGCDVACGQAPEWIWHDKSAQAEEVRFFRKTFTIGFKPQRAELTAVGDDQRVSRAQPDIRCGLGTHAETSTAA